MATEQPTRTNRGPVEEVVAKRMKALGKKLQRFRSYKSQPEATLNVDQKSGLASLPALEGTYKELEELSKQIEYVELEQAGKIREVKEQSKKDAEAHGIAKVEEFQASLSTPLSLFLRLYALLHPARSSDHDHLTFARLELPRNMQDAVQATDVLRVGRWYEDILAGGERGKVVIGLLVKSSGGLDEEDDRVHHLLNLLEESDSLSPEEEPAQELGSEQQEQVPAPEVDDEEALEVTEEEVNGQNEVPEPEAPADEEKSVGLVEKVKDMVFNFLQEDELVQPIKAAVQPQAKPVPSEPRASQAAPATKPAAAPASSNPPTKIQNTPRQAIPSFDWAAEDDEEHLASSPAGSSMPEPVIEPSQPAQPEAKTSNDDTGDQIIEENVLANAHVSQPLGGAPPAVENPVAPAPVPMKNVNGGPGRGRGRERGRAPSQQQRTQQQQSQNQRKLNEDGFQVVGKPQPGQATGQPPSQGQGQSARGGRGRGRPGRGRGGGRGGKAQAVSAPQEGQSKPVGTPA